MADAVTGAVIGALRGSFCAAFFNEKMADYFSCRRRKRETRAVISMELVHFFYPFPQQISIINLPATLQEQSKMLKEMRNAANDSNEADQIKTELIRLTDLLNMEVERENLAQREVSSYEDIIHGLLMEYNQYLTHSSKKRITACLSELRQQRYIRNVMVDSYRGDEYDERIKYRWHSK